MRLRCFQIDGSRGFTSSVASRDHKRDARVQESHRKDYKGCLNFHLDAVSFGASHERIPNGYSELDISFIMRIEFL